MKNSVINRYFFNSLIYSLLIILCGVVIVSVGIIHELKKKLPVTDLNSVNVFELKDNEHIAIMEYQVEREIIFRDRKYYILQVNDENHQPLAYMFTQVIENDGLFQGWLSSKDEAAYYYFEKMMKSSNIPLLKYEIKPFWEGRVVIILGTIIIIMGLISLFLSLLRIRSHDL